MEHFFIRTKMVIFLSFIMIIGCKKENIGNSILIPLKIQDHRVELSSICDSIQVVKLEGFDNDIIIDQVSNIIVDESQIIIYDDRQKKILRFDINGSYLNSIGRFGKGPNEFLSIQDFEIDHENSCLWAFDMTTNYLLKYDLEGYTCFKRHVDHYASAFELYRGGLLFFNPIVRSRFSNNYSLFHWEENQIANYFLERMKTKEGIILPFNFEKVGSTYFIWDYDSNEILYFNDPERIMNKISIEYPLKKSTREEFMARMGRAPVTEYRPHIGRVLLTNHYMFVNYYYKYYYSLVIDLNERQVQNAFYKTNGFINDFLNNTVFWPKFISSNGILIDTIEPLELISKDSTIDFIIGNHSEISPITQTDNPIIVFAYVKENY